MSFLASVSVAGVVLPPSVFYPLLAVLSFLLYTFWLHSGRPRGNPLVFSWVPHLRSALKFGQDPNTFLAECKKKYGPVFTLNLGGRLITFITDPECYPHISKARDGLSFALVASGVGEAVLGETHDYAHDQELDAIVHAQYAKHLSGVGLDEITATFQSSLHVWFDALQRRMKSTDSNGYVETGLLDFVTRAIFSSSTRALFGDLLVSAEFDSSPSHHKISTPARFDENFSDDFFEPSTLLTNFQAFDAIFPMLYGGLPHFLLRSGIQARDRICTALRSLRENSCTFLRVREEALCKNPPNPRETDKEDFGRTQIGMLWALQGNTIPASFWVLFFLLKHPDQFRRAQEELDRVIKESKENGESVDGRINLSRESLKQLGLLDAAISESLRLSTGSMMMRRATRDMTLDLPTGALHVRAGDSLAIYPHLTHHDPTIFPRPNEFDLTRFEGKPIEGGTVTDVNGRRVPNAMMPFGSGVSMCPGRYFARNEIKIFLALFLERFEFDMSRGAEAVQHPGYLLSRAGLGIFPPAKDVQIKYRQKKKTL